MKHISQQRTTEEYKAAICQQYEILAPSKHKLKISLRCYLTVGYEWHVVEIAVIVMGRCNVWFKNNAIKQRNQHHDHLEDVCCERSLRNDMNFTIKHYRNFTYTKETFSFQLL
jgi:hypothetical protein